MNSQLHGKGRKFHKEMQKIKKLHEEEQHKLGMKEDYEFKTTHTLGGRNFLQH
jgi:hypothetical protein